MKAMRAKKTNKSVKPYEKGAFNIFNTIGQVRKAWNFGAWVMREKIFV